MLGLACGDQVTSDMFYAICYLAVPSGQLYLMIITYTILRPIDYSVLYSIDQFWVFFNSSVHSVPGALADDAVIDEEESVDDMSVEDESEETVTIRGGGDSATDEGEERVPPTQVWSWI